VEVQDKTKQDASLVVAHAPQVVLEGLATVAALPIHVLLGALVMEVALGVDAVQAAGGTALQVVLDRLAMVAAPPIHALLGALVMAVALGVDAVQAAGGTAPLGVVGAVAAQRPVVGVL